MKLWETQEHKTLAAKATSLKAGPGLRELLKDKKRTEELFTCAEGFTLDASRSLVDSETLQALEKAYERLGVGESVKNMFAGAKLNSTEGRAVGHVALRGAPFTVDGHDCAADVAHVKKRIYEFAERVRKGNHVGHSGRALTNVVCIGIGGSFLGIEFVHESLRTQDACVAASTSRQLRFLANVDPIDVRRALQSLDPEATLVVILSKTFTTAETMLNAQTVRAWLLKHYSSASSGSAYDEEEILKKHLCAVSTNLKATAHFGVADENVFGFWDWVGGRFSVCSAVGVLPLALQYGTELVEQFLAGCRTIDNHVLANAHKPQHSLAARMALLSLYNASYLDYNTVAVLPYCQALHRFPAHIQQLAMESNGKGVCIDGASIPSDSSSCAPDIKFTGEIYFGEPGTNGQHSFYQLIHQGRVVPCEFIGFTNSQAPAHVSDVASHDELMSNFFAQPDALAYGKSKAELEAEGCPAALVPHKTFTGNRPSMCLLINGEANPRSVGALLALYEHRVAIEGFMWGINSFDQWGVELGKMLAKNIRGVIKTTRDNSSQYSAQNSLPDPTNKLLDIYFANSK